MSERKVLNKYYPPDFDPSKIPRMKLAKNRQYTVRLMAPFNMRCVTCGEYIYKGKKFNARKEDVEHETYLGIRIYRFYIKCTRCLQEISFKTDPRNTDYEIEAGATRNFMALKLAEEQAQREEQELREEEANNPMKLLENRTQQSRNEIEMLESLEELRDLNRRQQTVDYETMLQKYDTTETERERLERQEREDEEYIKSVNFKHKGAKIVAEEIIEEVKDEGEGTPTPAKVSKPSQGATFAQPLKAAAKSSSSSLSNLGVKRKTPLVLVKPKSQTPLVKPKEATPPTSSTKTNEAPPKGDEKKVSAQPATSTTTTTTTGPATTTTTTGPPTAPKSGGGGGLSLLGAYSDSSEEDSS